MTIEGMKGSRLRICQWVDEAPDQLEARLRGWPTLDEFRADDPIDWLSPRRDGGYEEIGDDLWIKAGLPGQSPQKAGFWPKRGPSWDAVGLVPGHDEAAGVLLVEARATRPS
jgi:hypothetical protein